MKVEINPRFANVYFNRGILKNELKDDNGAIADFNVALRTLGKSGKDPAAATVNINRGFSKANLGQNKAAVTDFTKVLELNPGNQNAYLYRGMVKGSLKD